LNSRFACMYNYASMDFNYQFQVSYDRTDPKNAGIVFKAYVIPTNAVSGGTNAVLLAQCDQLGAYFQSFNPHGFSAFDQPVAYMTDDCHVLDVRVPFNNQTSYLRPSQLVQQDRTGTATATIPPVVYRDGTGANVHDPTFLRQDMPRYCSGFLCFGIDSASLVDPTTPPVVKVIVRFSPGDNVRYMRLFQIPRLLPSNIVPIPLVSPFVAPTVTKARVIENGRDVKR